MPLILPSAIITAFAAVSICIIAIAPAHAGIYKWVDEQGQVHYGERPQTGTAEKLDINVRKPEAEQAQQDDDAAAQPGAGEAQPDTPQPPGQASEEWVEQKLSRSEKRKRCARDRDRLQAVLSKARLRDVDAQGNVRYMSEKERQQRIRQIRKNIREYCR